MLIVWVSFKNGLPIFYQDIPCKAIYKIFPGHVLNEFMFLRILAETPFSKFIFVFAIPKFVCIFSNNYFYVLIVYSVFHVCNKILFLRDALVGQQVI